MPCEKLLPENLCTQLDFIQSFNSTLSIMSESIMNGMFQSEGFLCESAEDFFLSFKIPVAGPRYDLFLAPLFGPTRS